MLLQMNLDSVGIIYAAWDESFIIFLILSSVGSWCLCAHYDDSAVVRGHLERAVFFFPLPCGSWGLKLRSSGLAESAFTQRANLLASVDLVVIT